MQRNNAYNQCTHSQTHGTSGSHMTSGRASVAPLMLSLLEPVAVVGAAVAPVTVLLVVAEVLADAVVVVIAARKSGRKY